MSEAVPTASVEDAFMRVHEAVLFAAAGELAGADEDHVVTATLALRVRVDHETEEIIVELERPEGPGELYRVSRP